MKKFFLLACSLVSVGVFAQAALPNAKIEALKQLASHSTEKCPQVTFNSDGTANVKSQYVESVKSNCNKYTEIFKEACSKLVFYTNGTVWLNKEAVPELYKQCLSTDEQPANKSWTLVVPKPVEVSAFGLKYIAGIRR